MIVDDISTDRVGRVSLRKIEHGTGCGKMIAVKKVAARAAPEKLAGFGTGYGT